MSQKVFHCMFEQSGTFKNEFKKLGYEAFDYDILNDFGETDYLIDLFKEIENPAGEQHYLTRYWAIKSKVVDTDRTKMGDFQKKPTQYWFINREPSYNFIFEGISIKKKRTHNGLWWNKNHTVERSMISKDYANRFIREFILEEGGVESAISSKRNNDSGK